MNGSLLEPISGSGRGGQQIYTQRNRYGAYLSCVTDKAVSSGCNGHVGFAFLCNRNCTFAWWGVYQRGKTARGLLPPPSPWTGKHARTTQPATALTGGLPGSISRLTPGGPPVADHNTTSSNTKYIRKGVSGGLSDAPTRFYGQFWPKDRPTDPP